MKHPSETDLALYAGGELGRVAKWRAARHIEQCERCQIEVATFEATRREAAALDGLPAIAWDRLAREMRANIRLGLAAGEIVRTAKVPQAHFTRPRSLVAACCVAALLVAGLWLQQPAPTLTAREPAWLLETTANGIAVRQGDQVMTLVNGGAGRVVYSTGAQGVMRARYVDSETGQVTINHVYVQ